MRGRFAFVAVLSLAVASAGNREDGYNHFFNLEYDDAIRDFQKYVEQNPEDPLAYNGLAAAQLYKELYRLGLLESSALRGDNQFLEQKRPEPDPQAKAQFEQTLQRGRQLAEARIAKNRKDEAALYALSNNFALRGNYEFMVDKAWFAALRSGSKAREYSDQIRKANPGFIDAYLVLGIHEYVVGSLPLPVKMLAAVGGLHGNKEKGKAYVQRVAQEGNLARTDARALLVILYRREKRPLDAAKMLEGLLQDFPRNYVFALELGSMYAEAGQNARALETFQSTLKKAEDKAPGFDRLPRAAVKRKIERLQSGS